MKKSVLIILEGNKDSVMSAIFNINEFTRDTISEYVSVSTEISSSTEPKGWIV